MPNTRKAGHAAGDAKHAAHGAANPAPEAEMSRDILNIPDNVLLDGIKGYSPDDQKDLEWMMSYARKELGNSRSRLCELLGTHYSTIFKICTGRYEASIRSFIEKVRDLRRRAVESGQAGLIETVVTRKIWNTLDYALAGDLSGGHMVMISGHTGRGKSFAGVSWCRSNNHGTSFYIDAPVGGGFRNFVVEIAKQAGVNTSRKTAELCERVTKSFNRRRIIVVDEVRRLMPGRSGERIDQLEFLRRLHDVTGCAVALICTPIFRHEMEHGYLRDYLEQFLGRLSETIEVPEKVRRDECLEICRAFNKRADKALVDRAVQFANEPGRLRVLFDDLRKAQLLATRQGETLGEKHLHAAHQRRVSRKDWPADN